MSKIIKVKEKNIEELLTEITRLKKELKKKKKYGLVWEEKKEDVVELCKENLPILVEEKSKSINEVGEEDPVNILIEGDNYHALSALNYTHERKIDVIYIDPPYNTGAKDWKYNNDYVDSEDAFRHSKWICMMEKRIKLSKKLLKKNGVLCCTIDEYELFSILGIFNELNSKILSIVTIVNKAEGRNQKKYFTGGIEYAVFVTWGNPEMRGLEIEEINSCDECGKKISGKEKNKKVTKSKEFSWVGFHRRNPIENPTSSNRWYPIYLTNNGELSLIKVKNSVEIFPVNKKGDKKIWGWKKERLAKYLEKNKDDFKSEKYDLKNEIRYKILHKRFDVNRVKPKSYWIGSKYNAYSYGTKLLKEILQTTETLFEFPKSVKAVIDCIDLFLPEDGIVLDYFAGSGTTGHAALELNKRDDGTRKFILVTNNENDICNKVTYPRIKNVIKGYKVKNEKVEGLASNLKFYKTDFVDAKQTDKNKKILTEKATDMLCIKESTFDEIKTKNKYFRIFKSGIKYTGIIYDYMEIDEFKGFINKIDGRFNVYIFSLGDDTFDEEFLDLRGKVKLFPIPEAIMRAYRRLFK